MATIDLGKIKLVWRGAYNNSTAYTPDDVVSSGGSSYICKVASTGNAVTNGTYWDSLAEGGDVATTLTTQGDILYRDGSGLQRLAKGTAGQALKMNSSANAPEWGAAGGVNTPAFFVTKSATQSISHNTSTQITFDTEAIDTDNAFASNAFTVPSGKGGIYYLVAQMRIDTGDDYDGGIIKLRVNSTDIGASWGRNEYYDHYNISMLHSLSAGDVVTTNAFQNVGATKNIGHIDQGKVTFFGGFRIIQ
tara:strand:- start:272 stop:1015 length:744 start_codon:yes stop_codon:yes gene_type:complete